MTTAGLTRALTRGLTGSLVPRRYRYGGGGGGGPFDPADIDYGALTYSRRFWWHKSYADSLSVNTNGTGGTPGVGDPFGAILNCDQNNGDTPLPLALLPQQGTAGIRRANGAEFPVGAFYYSASANWTEMASQGLTVAFSGFMPTFSTGGWVFGRDNPSSGVGSGGSNSEVFLQHNVVATGVDLTVEHRIVITATHGGGNVRALLDGVEVFNGTDQGFSTWERTMFYMYSAAFTLSGIFAIDSRVSNAEMANLDNFLQYGPV